MHHTKDSAELQLQELHWACGRDGDKERAQKLLHDGASPSIWLSGWSAIHCAARFNRAEIVILLLTQNPQMIDLRTAWGHTALIICAQCNHVELARILILRGADWFAITALCAGVALSRADPFLHDSVSLEPPPLSAENDWGSLAEPRPTEVETQEVVAKLKSAFFVRQLSVVSLSEALCSACGGQGSKREVSQLLDLGANPWLYFEGWCALHFAAMAGSMPILHQLLEFGVSLDAPTLVGGGWGGIVTSRGCTALHIAASFSRYEACRLLLEKGADLRILNADGRSAIQEYGKKLSKSASKVPSLDAVFAAGPHPSQVQRRKDEVWARKGSVVVALAKDCVADQPFLAECWSIPKVRNMIVTFL